MKISRLLNKRILVIAILGMLAMTACKKKDDGMMPANPTGMLSVSDQVISQNSIMVSSVTFDQDGWIVVHADAGSGPQVPDIISEPVMVKAGTQTDVKVPLVTGADIHDGDKVWVMLHTDTGVKGTYEFDGSSSSADMPITDASGNIVMQPITISAPSIMADNQVVDGNMVKIAEVDAAVDGWIVIHNDDGTGNITLPGIIGKTYVNVGMNKDVMIQLDSTVQIAPGQKLFPMLHVDDPANGNYDFPANGDGPEVFGFNGTDPNILVTSINVEAPTGSLDVSDQTISQNMIMVSSITMNAAGWVVVHKDNGSGPVVPGIFSEPVHLDAGTTTNVMIPIKPGTDLMDGESLWVMLHNDNGSIGTYEFDGASGYDNPIVMNANIVMKKIKIMVPSIMVSDQAVVNDQVTLDKVVLAADGWLVVHNDDGTGHITLPGIIGKVYLEKGEHTNVTIDLDSSNRYLSGQKLFPMVHLDNPANKEYDFPDNGDNPEVFGFQGNSAPAIVVTSFNVL